MIRIWRERDRERKREELPSNSPVAAIITMKSKERMMLNTIGLIKKSNKRSSKQTVILKYQCENLSDH